MSRLVVGRMDQQRGGVLVTFPDGRRAIVHTTTRSGTPGDAVGGISIQYEGGAFISISNGSADERGRLRPDVTTLRVHGQVPSTDQIIQDATMLLRSPEFINSRYAGTPQDRTSLMASAIGFADLIQGNHQGQGITPVPFGGLHRLPQLAPF